MGHPDPTPPMPLFSRGSRRWWMQLFSGRQRPLTAPHGAGCIWLFIYIGCTRGHVSAKRFPGSLLPKPQEFEFKVHHPTPNEGLHLGGLWIPMGRNPSEPRVGRSPRVVLSCWDLEVQPRKSDRLCNVWLQKLLTQSHLSIGFPLPRAADCCRIYV